MRRRIGDEGFMPDSRLMIVSRSEMEDASEARSGGVSWHACRLDEAKRDGEPKVPWNKSSSQ